MEKDVKKRLSAKSALQHTWIQNMQDKKFDKELNIEKLENLKSFHATQKMSQAAITFMVTQLATKGEQSKLRNSFNQFDTNGDGVIEFDEFLKGYASLYPQLSADELKVECDKLFKQADTDGNGTLSYEEWCVATINKRDLLN